MAVKPAVVVSAIAVIAIMIMAVYYYAGSIEHPSTAHTIAASTASTTIGNSTTYVTSTSVTSSTTTVNSIKNPNATKYNDSFIVFNPVNFSQISWVSKFRSCVGHNYSGYDTNGTLEPTSSMKHYFGVQSAYQGRQFPVYAPFNGYVTSLAPEPPDLR